MSPGEWQPFRRAHRAHRISSLVNMGGDFRGPLMNSPFLKGYILSLLGTNRTNTVNP